ncbi:MAG: tandem-95 repeat protein [Caldilineaceae bacterium]|nr:tandem-95 repeat protein [Caldilineaceae bacterium]
MVAFTRRPGIRRLWSVIAIAAILISILPVAPLAQPALAAGGDFANTDFAAAAPFTYNHATGGGAYNDRTVGDFGDVTEQLEGGEFTCGDTVTYLAQIEVAANPVDANQTIELDFRFLADSTGQSGAALSDITYVGINYGQVENGDDGTGTNPGAGNFGLDSGIMDDGGSTATLVAESLTGPLFQSGSDLLGTVQIDDLEAGEKVVLRIDVLLSCNPGSSPTGNLQGQLDAGRVIAPVQETINTGQQTIPFLKVGEIFGAGEPVLQIEKTVTTANGTCGVDDVETLSVTAPATVKYCYSVSNPGTADLFDVAVEDDNGTPGNTSDDFIVSLSGLSNLDGQADAGDLPSGATATGEALVTMNIGGTVTNLATATGNNGRSGGNFQVLTDADTATVEVAGPVNQPPVAADDSASTPEDTAVSINVASNDIDPDGNLDPTSAVLISGPANGTLVNNGDGTFTYTPNANFNGTDSFVYEICDTDGLCDQATVTITVTPVNDGPDAVDDSYSTAEDTPLTVPAPGVLNNDTDVDGDALTVTGYTQPANGTVVQNADGSLTYTPNANFNGTDSYTYTISDGNGGTDTATVTITVSGVNDAPDAVNDSASVNEDQPVTIPVLNNDVDPDGDPLTVTDVSDPANGSAVINPDGTVTYTPDPDFCGTDTFTYTISDGNGGTDTATVTVEVICVNDPPVANDDTANTDEDVPVTVPVLDNDRDPDGDPLTVTAVSDPPNGSVVINPDGTVTYTPDQDFNGEDTFTYTICDPDGLCDTATVTVVIGALNDPPVANDDNVTTPEDTPVAFNVASNDVDVDGNLDPSTTTVLDGPDHGTLVNNGDGTFSYTPDPNYNGPDSFTYEICDTDGLCDMATVYITVTPVNDAPDAVNDSYNATEDTPLTIPAPGVLFNDTDVDGDALTVVDYTQPASGTLMQNADGSFTYAPNANFCGIDSYTYTISDGNGGSDTATVTIDVACVNDAPVAADDAYSTDEDVALTIGAPGVLVNDSDVDGDALSVASYTQPANGTVVANPDGSFTYTPDANFNGVDTFDYTISDGNGGSDTATVTITVNPVNDAPDAVNDSYNATEDTPLTIPAPGVLFNDTDVDGDALTVVDYTQPASGTLMQNADGSFTYAPNANFCGIDSYTYTISDGNGGSDTATVTIDVACVNDAPVAVDDTGSTDEDTVLNVAAPGILSNDYDVDMDSLTVTAINGDSTAVGQQITLASGALLIVYADGSYSYDPNGQYDYLAVGETAQESFTYEISDGNGGSDSATVTITIVGVNDAPEAVDDAYVTAQDIPLIVAAPGVLGNDKDVDGDAIYVDSYDVTSQFGGSISMTPDGSFTYTPAPGFTGIDSYTYTISDGNGGYDTAVVTIEVTPRNNRSIAVDLQDWSYDSGSRSFSGQILITNQSGTGYDVQITDLNLLVQVRSPSWDYKGWVPVALAGDSCSFSPDPYFLITDQQLVTFSGCELVYDVNGETIPADASIRLTAEVEIYGRFKGAGKTVGQNRGLFLSRHSKSVGEAIDGVIVGVYGSGIGAMNSQDPSEEQEQNIHNVLFLPTVMR